MDEILEKELDRLGILDLGDSINEESDGYLIKIKNQDTWGKYFSLLDTSDLKSEEEDELDLFHSVFKFYSKYYTYTLTSDFEKDKYELKIMERN